MGRAITLAFARAGKRGALKMFVIVAGNRPAQTKAASNPDSLCGVMPLDSGCRCAHSGRPIRFIRVAIVLSHPIHLRVTFAA